MTLSDYDTAQAVAQAKTGDCDAFSMLYETFSADLYRFAFYMLGTREDAQDAVQDAVLQAYTHIGSLKKDAAFKSWFFKILSNCCKAKLIRASRQGGVLPLEDFSDLAPDERAAEFFSSLELRDAIYRLSEEDRTVVLFSVIGGYKSHEIAKILQLPPSTVRSKLSRSLEKLKRFLADAPKSVQALNTE
ncbi:MAG: RNA polymerase sigma factor [Oscillospiraceae bacterium]|jgi:RNA polymerase sigma-70 factor (ECF subfamily)|nr:RNA polymerase sigma factor [Oscillospiraceae bacterium]